MNYSFLTTLVVLGALSLYGEDEGLITRGAEAHHQEIHHSDVHPHTNAIQHPDAARHEVNRAVENRNLNNSGGYGGGYIIPSPATSGDPLQDPNDDINQIYKQNQQNMQRTGQ